MSRSRPIDTPHGSIWVDTKQHGQKATHEQLELLAANLDAEIDDVLDTYITQGEVVKELRSIMGQTPPADVISRVTAARAMRQTMPECRVCGRVGDSTQHHFVNKWILRELDGYERQWAKRKLNCIPVCIDCHRDLHARDNGSQSIAHLLTAEEKEFAERALTALSEERPKLLILIARGSDSTYETRLVRDWLEGRFGEEAELANTVAYLRAV
jgi:hypothetical protein